MKKTVFFLFLALACAPLAAQQLSLTGQSVPKEASFAQPYDVRFELAHTPGYVVEIDREHLPEKFELTSVQSKELSPGTLSYDLTFLPFTLGPSTFTAVTFDLKEKAGGETLAQASSDAQNVEVKPVKLFKEQTLRDIRPPYIPSGWLLWALIFIVILLLVYYLRRFIQDVRAQKLAVREVRDNRPADVIALDKIQALLQSGLWEKAEYKLFYIELGDILREYFWRRFNQDVSSDTSAELLRRARGVPQLHNLLYPLREYLNSSDLVKFAKVTPSQDLMHKDVKTVRDIVRETSPRPAQTQEDK